MGQSSGAGSPAWFMCHSCRLARGSKRAHEGVPAPQDVRLTGKTRKHYTGHNVALGERGTKVSRQYECQKCLHVGWSNHADLEQLAAGPSLSELRGEIKESVCH